MFPIADSRPETPFFDVTRRVRWTIRAQVCEKPTRSGVGSQTVGFRNCWEAMCCGREPGGTNAEALGVCPAATDASGEGVNHSEKSGRICWCVAGTFCRDGPECANAKGLPTCLLCEFFSEVREEEGDEFRMLPLRRH